MGIFFGEGGVELRLSRPKEWDNLTLNSRLDHSTFNRLKYNKYTTQEREILAITLILITYYFSPRFLTSLTLYPSGF